MGREEVDGAKQRRRKGQEKRARRKSGIRKGSGIHATKVQATSVDTAGAVDQLEVLAKAHGTGWATLKLNRLQCKHFSSQK